MPRDKSSTKSFSDKSNLVDLVLQSVTAKFGEIHDEMQSIRAKLDELDDSNYREFETQIAVQEKVQSVESEIENLRGILKPSPQTDGRIAALEAKIGNVKDSTNKEALLELRLKKAENRLEISDRYNGELNSLLVSLSKRIFDLERHGDSGADTEMERSDPGQASKMDRLREEQTNQARRFIAEYDFSKTPVICVVCPVYPGGARAYGGEFIQSRIEEYTRLGAVVHVFEVDEKWGQKEISKRVVNGVRVFSGSPADLGRFLRSNRNSYVKCCIHFVSDAVYEAAINNIDKSKLAIWMHGFEARDYKRLMFNFEPAYLRQHGLLLETINAKRMSLLRKILPERQVSKVFVSNFIKNIAETDSGASAQNSFVIHNVISEKLFSYNKKPQGFRRKILWIRSFAARNYANDLARDVILELSKKSFFKELEFSIFGDGKFFDECAEQLRDFDNVTIQQKFLGQGEIAEFHKSHGIMLVPSRFDTQGVTMGEAMSSGLVCITNRVAAIPEFADQESVFAEDPEDAAGMATAIERLYHDPELFSRMSANASRRAKSQCGVAATVYRELAEVILK